MTAKRVVITGIGAVTPYGLGIDSLWNSLVEGRSAISTIQNFNTQDYAVKIAGEIKEDYSEQFFTPKEVKKLDRFVQFGMIAVELALKDSGLDYSDEYVMDNTGIFASSGIGGLITIQENHQTLLNKGPKRVSPQFIPMVLSNLLPGHISIKYGFKGPNFSIVSACASGAHCIGHAAEAIKHNRAKYMIAGASEAVICELGIAGFASMRALSTRNDEPTKASRPWDKDRDGFVMSEGGALVLLEDYDSAVKRGAKIYAEILGYGLSGDAYHIVMPHETGDGAKRCMISCLNDAGINAEDIDYINAHGTATPVGDIAEAKAIKELFKNNINALNVSSSKSMTGHLLGAAGSLELAITALCMKNSVVVPTINLDNIDPECSGVNFTPHTAIKKNINYAMSNSFGFGGTNSSIILRKL